MTQSTWNPNSLPAGDFEHLSHMTQTGWENRKVDNLGLQSKVELSKDAAVSGTYGLKMSVQPTRPVQVVQATPVWIASAKVPVKAGQMVRIHGWVNVSKVIGGSHDGLTIMESIGGPDLVERIPITNGWQEFTLYRGVQEDTDLQVKLALTGIGTVLVDEVTIRTIDLPSQAGTIGQAPHREPVQAVSGAPMRLPFWALNSFLSFSQRAASRGPVLDLATNVRAMNRHQGNDSPESAGEQKKHLPD